MDAQDLKNIFEKRYNREDWYKIAKELLSADQLLAKPAPIKLPDNEWGAEGFELGNLETTDGRLIGLYELVIGKKAQLHRNRKGLKDLLAKVYKENVDAALIVFVQGAKWRFSYVSEIYIRNKETGKRERKATDPKRYTYLLGEGERCKTAADRFVRIKQSSSLFQTGVTLEALEEAFNVEKMSKDFFNEYRKHYGSFTAFLTGKNEDGREVRKAHPFLRSIFNGDEKDARDFVKKLLGRIVFLYFLQKKGWLGVPEGGKWGEGNEDFLHQLFLDYKDKEGFYALVLAPLFFETLNTEREGDLFKIKSSLFTKPGYNKLKLPYLNGGLFDNDQPETDRLDFPRELFEKLFLFFDQYNFTVYEDSPDEHTVAVDPEMLGHIFENLLEDNKDKGAYYTPKEIVHYMCRESLIEYLYTKLNPTTFESYQELGKNQTDLFGNKGKGGQLALVKKHNEGKELVSREAIEKFIKNHEAAAIIDWDESILKALKEVKVCDPAIGSGAFPMGILMEIFHAVETLFYANPDTVNAIWKLGNDNVVFNAAKAKESIIQNSIYGVDIEKGAVDIARLRFWLSLVVDETKPKPLPNLDYKIVVGNSLLSKFEDEVIDIDWTIKYKNASPVEKIVLDQQKKLALLPIRQDLYFNVTGDKTNLQAEIRSLKIDIIINQLTLTKIGFNENNPKLGGFAATPKEIQKNLENELVLAGYDKAIQKLEALKKDKNAALDFFDWKLDFPEIMNEKVVKGECGFDIVIANPPYINIVNVKEQERTHLQEKFSITKNKVDLYAYFIEKSKQLIKENSSLVFIIPQTWKATDSFSKFRAFLFEHFCVKSIVNLNLGVFDAVVIPLIIHLRSGKVDNYAISIRNSDFEEFSFIDVSEIIKSPHLVVDTESSKTFKTLFKRIEENSTLLGEVVQFTRGIKTSNDSRFILKEKRNKDCKKVFRGKNVKAYQLNWNGEFIWYRPDLMREKVGCLPHTKDLFEVPEKIVTQRVNSSMQLLVAYDDGQNYFLDTTNVSRYKTLSKEFNLKYLLALLNSKTLNFWYCNNYRMPTIGLYELHSIPIKKASNKLQTKVIKLVDKIINARKNASGDVIHFLQQIDIIVYKLYQLEYSEACIIEGNTNWLSKEKYESYIFEEKTELA